MVDYEKIQERLKNAALSLGLMVYPSAGCIDGVRGDHVLIAPPFNVTGSEIDLIVNRLVLTLKLVLGR